MSNNNTVVSNNNTVVSNNNYVKQESKNTDNFVNKIEEKREEKVITNSRKNNLFCPHQMNSTLQFLNTLD